jgi:hypothetical protein
VHLFLAPEGGISVFIETHYRLARLLASRGHEVAGVFCHEVFPRCPVMEMRRLPYTAGTTAHHAYCLHCAATTDAMARGFGIPLIDLRSWPVARHREAASRLVAAHTGELLDFTYDRIAFGKLAAMDLVLATKRAQLESPPADVRHKWATFVEASVFSYLLFSQVLDEIPVARLVHFNDYSIMLGARLAAERRGIPAFGITQASHLNNDNRRTLIRRDIGPCHGWSELERWSDVRDIPLTPEQVADVCDDIILRLRATGSHTFSPAKTFSTDTLRGSLRLADDRRLIVAYTSSLDERIATTMTTLGAGRQLPAIREIFPNQIEWLRFLTDHVARSTNLQLVVRIHPREGAGGMAAKAGKILAVESEHLGLLRQAFPHDPDHCRIIWPDDNVSSYDLAEIADAATVSWSTIGLELARFAVPVVGSVLGYGPYVDDDFTRIPATAAEYADALEHSTTNPVCPGRWARALRFYHHFFLGTALDIRDCVDAEGCLADDDSLRSSAAAAACESVFVHGRSVSAAISSGGSGASKTAFESERSALADCAMRLIGFFSGQSDGKPAIGREGDNGSPAVRRLRQLHAMLVADAQADMSVSN